MNYVPVHTTPWCSRTYAKAKLCTSAINRCMASGPAHDKSRWINLNKTENLPRRRRIRSEIQPHRSFPSNSAWGIYLPSPPLPSRYPTIGQPCPIMCCIYNGYTDAINDNMIPHFQFQFDQSMFNDQIDW